MIKISTNLSTAFSKLYNFLTRKEKEINLASELAVIKAADTVQTEIIRAIKEVDAVASGELLRSVTVSTLTSSADFFTANVSSSAHHAKFVEEGAKYTTRQPPAQRIYEWMIVKGLQPSMSGAFAIARKIKERGLPEKRPFQTGTDRARARIQTDTVIIFDKTLTKD